MAQPNLEVTRANSPTLSQPRGERRRASSHSPPTRLASVGRRRRQYPADHPSSDLGATGATDGRILNNEATPDVSDVPGRAPELGAFAHALTEAGWRVRLAMPGYGFGSWLIELEDGLRVFYDGSQGELGVKRATSRDVWVGVWKTKSPDQQTADAVLSALQPLRVDEREQPRD
jgi:hypothetical protein